MSSSSFSFSFSLSSSSTTAPDVKMNLDSAAASLVALFGSTSSTTDKKVAEVKEEKAQAMEFYTVPMLRLFLSMTEFMHVQ